MAKILIAGGSLGGLFAANILLRAGHQVLVLEKASESLDGRGAGIVTHKALERGLIRAGVTVDETLGVRIKSRVSLQVDGTPDVTWDFAQVLTSWSRLYHLLLGVLPAEHYLHGAGVKSVTQSEHGVSVLCDDGRAFDGDLLVASDGIRSAVRAQYAPAVQPEYAGYVAWRGVCDEALLSKFTLDSVFERFGFGLPPGEQLIGYPVAGANNSTERGKRRFNFVWYRPAEEPDGLNALLTDADGNFYPLGIPPHKVSWRNVAAMREAGRRLLAPQFAEILEKTALPFLQPIYDVYSEQIAFGRVMLMGDAAFVARPHCGMGVTKAAQDAGAIADAIDRHGATPAAALAYQEERLKPGQDVIRLARNLGAYMQSQTGSRKGSVARSDENLVRETAVDPAEAATLA